MREKTIFNAVKLLINYEFRFSLRLLGSKMIIMKFRVVFLYLSDKAGHFFKIVKLLEQE